MVFAAASLTDSLKEIAVAYERSSRDKIVFNFGASSALARQIEAGAPADIFFSADEAKMNDLAGKGLVLSETRRRRLSNTLVIVVAAGQEGGARTPADLAGAAVKRVALGDPRAVPAGVYAREYLEKLGLWAAVQPKVVALDNVRSALAAVEAGNAEAGIVYKTDAVLSKRVKVACEVPREIGPSIIYPVALLKDAPQPAASRKFLARLDSEEAAQVFRKFGFIVLDTAKP